MDKLFTYVGGTLGGYVLTKIPVSGTFLSSLEPIVDTIGIFAMLLFSGALIYQAGKMLIGK